MKYSDEELDTLLECAIREKGLLEHMKRIDAMAAKIRRLRIISFAAAACIAIAVCVSVNLHYSSKAKLAGESIELFAEGRGSSEIIFMINDGRLSDALKKIENTRERLSIEQSAPSVDDPEYLTEVNADLQQLDWLKAVCLLKRGGYFKARQSLRDIASAGGAYSSQAKELLERL